METLRGAGLYVVLAVISVFVGLLVWTFRQVPGPVGADPLIDVTLPSGTGSARGRPQELSASLADHRTRRIAELQASLERKTEQYETLKAKLEDLVSRQMDGPTASGDSGAAEGDAGNRARDDAFALEVAALALAALEDDLRAERAERQRLAREVERLRQAGESAPSDHELLALLLEDADPAESFRERLADELAAWRAEAEQEQAAVHERHRVLHLAAVRVLVQAGDVAVPPLVDLLHDELPEVRAWAASVLAEIGPDAADAVPDLREALADPNAGVRAAARTALDAIE